MKVQNELKRRFFLKLVLSQKLLGTLYALILFKTSLVASFKVCKQRRSAMFIENRPNVTFDQIMFQNVSKEIYFLIHIQIIIFGSAQFLISMFN